MALDGTYTGLQASVSDWLNRSDLSALAPDFIAMAEGQMTDRLLAQGPVREMMGRSDATINSEFIAVPSDFAGAKAVYLGGNYLPLEFISPEDLISRKTLYPNVSGDPQAFAVVGGQLQFWPWNSGTFTGELTYWKRIPALSASNASNWLLVRRPDVYLYSALINSAPYLKDDNRLDTWASLAQAGLADLIEADKKARNAPNPGVGIVPGGTP